MTNQNARELEEDYRMRMSAVEQMRNTLERDDGARGMRFTVTVRVEHEVTLIVRAGDQREARRIARPFNPKLYAAGVVDQRVSRVIVPTTVVPVVPERPATPYDTPEG